jgi:hypothetical protein
MHSYSRIVIGSVLGIAALMIFLLGFHVAVQGPLSIGNFSPLLGAFIGGTLALVCVTLPRRQQEDSEPWLGQERLAWTLVGCGCIAWGLGESVWRFYEALGQTPFPSLADVGYASFPPLVFTGLLLLPSSKRGQRRTFFLLDSLIAMGALLSMAWFLLLGSLAQTPAETVLAKVLGLYYPTMDTALVSCTVFLLLRESGDGALASSRRISLLVAGVGLCVFAGADFLFNVQQNLGTYVEGTWIDLGWPLGMMALGMAVYVRRFLPASLGTALVSARPQRASPLRFGSAQALPYLLLVALLWMLVFNVLSPASAQQSIRPVLVAATMIVVGLVLTRQILTLLDNAQLLHKQTAMLQELEQINQSIAERKAVLEAAVTHLKDVQTRLANGDVRARAHLVSGELWPLASGLNLMADRMMRSERSQSHTQKVAEAVEDFSQMLERRRSGVPLALPASCLSLPEMHRLFLALGMKPLPQTPQPLPHAAPPRPRASPWPPVPQPPAASWHRQPSASPVRQQPSVEPPLGTSRLRRDV